MSGSGQFRPAASTLSVFGQSGLLNSTGPETIKSQAEMRAENFCEFLPKTCLIGMTGKFEMGWRGGIEAQRADGDRVSVRLRLLAGLRQEPNTDAKGEQLLLCRMPG